MVRDIYHGEETHERTCHISGLHGGWCNIVLCMYPANQRLCYNVTASLIGWAYTPNYPWDVITDTHPKYKSQESCLPVSYLSVPQSFWNFTQCMAVILPCPVQNFKMIEELIGHSKWMLWMNRISQVLPHRQPDHLINEFTLGCCP